MKNLKYIIRKVVPRSVRNWVRRPASTVRWLKDEGLARCGYKAKCEITEGWVIHCHPASVEAIRAEVNDLDQRRELADFIASCEPNMILFDIGASYGVFSLTALRYGGIRARSVAVDPSPYSNRILSHNVKLANQMDRLTIIQAAVGATDGEMEMLSTGPAGEHYFVGTEEDRPDTHRVPMYTLRSLAERTGFVPTHLKIDVEGFEGEILRGGIDWLREHKPLVFLELHNEMIRQRHQFAEDVLYLLKKCGYDRIKYHGRCIENMELLKKPVARIIAMPRSQHEDM